MAVTDKRLSDDLTEPIEIECFARGKVLDAGDGLGGAGEIGATPGDESFFLRDRPATRRTFSADTVVE